MNILICDDAPDHADALVGLLCHSGLPVHTRAFHCGGDALDYFQTGAVIDLCFLDIVMPEMSGVALAKALRTQGYTGAIVFLSTSREYAPESYEVKAFSYLLKPPTQARVNAVLGELQAEWRKRDTGSIVLKLSGGIKPVLHRDISYVEVIQHAVYFHMVDGGELAVYTTFGEVAAVLLRDPRFVQCHRSYIVNMDDILEIAKGEITMRSGAKVSISRTYNHVRDRYCKWEFGGNRT